MAHIQPAKGNYFGFEPVEAAAGLVQCNPYFVSSSEGAIAKGDCLMLTTLNTVKVNTGAAAMIGVAAHALAANAGSTAINQPVLGSSQVMLVYDSPEQVFVGCDSSSGLMLSSNMFKNVAILTTGVVGSSGPHGTLQRSVQAISALTASSGATVGPFKVVGIHPIEAGYSTAGATGANTDVRKFLLQPNFHALAIGSQGVVTS